MARETLLEEQFIDGFSLDDDLGVYVYSFDCDPIPPPADQLYTISWDGVDYVCYSYESGGSILFGNASLFGGTSTREPFAIKYTEHESGAITTFYASDEKGAHRVAVYLGVLDGVEGVILRNIDGHKNVYCDIDTVTLDTTTTGKTQSFAKGGTGIGVQADWSQSNPEKPDYIKNRPFYDHDERTELLPLTEFSEFTRHPNFGMYYAEIASLIEFVVGETYSINWDGREYLCIAQDSRDVIPNSVVVGNAEIFVGSGLNGNNEPFIIGTVDGNTAILLHRDIDAENPHFVRICHGAIEVKQIDQKYIPIPFFGTRFETILDCVFVDVKNEDGTWSGELFIEDTSDSTLVPGKAYTITWCNVEYTAIADELDGIQIIGNTDLLFGGEDNGCPFIIARDVTGVETSLGIPMWMAIVPLEEWMNEEGRYSCTISGKSITKIDADYLHQPDWNETDSSCGGYIANKPFYTMPEGTVVASETAVRCDTPYGEDGYYDFLFGRTNIGEFNYLVEFDGVSYELTGEVADNICSLHYSSDEVDFLIMSNDSATVIVSTYGVHTYKITLLEEVVFKIDKKYLPDINTSDGLPPVTIDNNGEVMTVVNGSWTAHKLSGMLPDVSALDDGKVLKVENGEWAAVEESQSVVLPNVTSQDVGKFLRVGADGSWIVETIQNVAEVGL